jgi:hypothetical protein
MDSTTTQPGPTSAAAGEASSRVQFTALLATLGHDLRTPLNAIIGYSELLQEEVREAGHEEWSRDLEQIRASGRQLLDLINPIIDLAKIEARRVALELEPVDLAALGRDVAAAVEPALSRRGGAFTMRSPAPDLAPVVADPARLRQCLIQLIRALLELSDVDQVALEVAAVAAAAVASAVPGVPGAGGGAPAEVRFLLHANRAAPGPPERDPNQPSWSGARPPPGAQLGLMLAQRLSEVMGGLLEMESGPGSAARFTLTLPGRARSGGDRPAATPAR